MIKLKNLLSEEKPNNIEDELRKFAKFAIRRANNHPGRLCGTLDQDIKNYMKKNFGIKV